MEAVGSSWSSSAAGTAARDMRASALGRVKRVYKRALVEALVEREGSAASSPQLSRPRPSHCSPAAARLPASKRMDGNFDRQVSSPFNHPSSLPGGTSVVAPSAISAPSSSSLPSLDSNGGNIIATEDQLTAWERDGYLVIENFADAKVVEGLRGRMAELIDAWRPEDEALTIFSTKNQDRAAVSNEYFLKSAGNVSFFLEERATDEEGNLTQPKELAINKIGHSLHWLDPVFREFSSSPRMAAMLRAVGIRAPIPVQSMYLCKQAGIGAEVAPHQDSTFLYTDPPTCVGMWLALQDATTENGCLWALPGSHKGPLHRRFLLGQDRKLSFDNPPGDYDASAMVPLPVPAGSLVVLHGTVLHQSFDNFSPVSRHAYSVHFVDEGAEWADDNWLQRSSAPSWEPLYRT